MIRWYGFCLAGFILLQGCAGPGGGAAPRIAALQNQEQGARSAALANPRVKFNINQQRLIDSYRELVSIAPQGEAYGREIQRLADLELESAIDLGLSSDPAQIKQGDELMRSAIRGYQRYLESYPDRADNDRILYQLARAYDMQGLPEKALQVLDRLAQAFPQSEYIDEVQFRRGERLFVEGDFFAAQEAYGFIVENQRRSQYFEKALYKFGWSRFKQNDYEEALGSFLELLDGRYRRRQISETGLSPVLSRSNQELINDVLRVVSLSFSYLPGKQPLGAFFNRVGKRSYEPLIYQRLAELYLDKQRITDAADVYISYSEHHPYSEHAPQLYGRAIGIIRDAGFSSLLLTEKENFIRKFNRGAFWEQQDAATQQALQPVLTAHMFDVSTHYHAVARASKKPADYQRAADSYRRYLDAFPDDAKSAQVNFLLAEALNDAGHIDRAIAEYEKTAYQYPAHDNAAEAGYAAILAYNELFKSSSAEDRAAINDKLIASSLRYSEQFVNDPRMPVVLMKTVEQFYDLQDFQRAQLHARRLVEIPQLDGETRLGAWIILAHSQFRLERFAKAENAYQNVIDLLRGNSRQRREMNEQLALSIYRQGELARQLQQHRVAAAHFERVGKKVPQSEKRIIADYDAATEYITLKDWSTAIASLEGFRKTYGKHKRIGDWQQGVSEKLALAYTSSGQHAKSAAELIRLVSMVPADQQRDLMWQAAELYQQAGKEKQAISVYKSYIKKYPQPLSRSIELRYKIALYHEERKDEKSREYWLREIIRADRNAGKQRSPRSRYLAATATLQLVRPVHDAFSRSELTIPLRKSLNKKKKLMKTSIDAYTRAAKYQVEEVTTTATFHIAEIYREFAVSLLESERPRNLNEEELEEYNYLLEDQAFPFEEKAISIHEKNVTRLADGSWDDAIRNSLQALGKLLPFRYAKNELTEEFVDE